MHECTTNPQNTGSEVLGDSSQGYSEVLAISKLCFPPIPRMEASFGLAGAPTSEEEGWGDRLEKLEMSRTSENWHCEVRGYTCNGARLQVTVRLTGGWQMITGFSSEHLGLKI